ncbi:MAG TPA: DUF899 domain-containing protein [Reyranella sp.]|jgi:predicted dithiol-disulfide oxidoreductase (DUF899 family)|nr:DUF899 domain-containing protein [Reyranella sp.]
MTTPRIVSHAEWLEARKAHLATEKEFTRARDELARQRRELPWVKVDKPYTFDAAEGRVSLGDLFGGKGQLLIYHFMMGPDWEEGCPSCSFWADNYNGVDVHLAHRDTALVAVSRAPLAKIDAYKKRMGWTFRWVSSAGSDFNFDYDASFKPDEEGLRYNFGTIKPFGEETPGISAFRRGDGGAIYHTYSTYARGLDMLNGAYHLLDLTSKGRDEQELPWPMAWVKRHDRY